MAISAIPVKTYFLRREKTYWTSDKARLHGRLAGLSDAWARKAGLQDVTLDSFIVSATPYGILQDYYGDGHWTRRDFADRHILFFGRGRECDYLATLFEKSA